MRYAIYLLLFMSMLFTCKEDKTHIVHREEIDEKEDFSPELRFGELFEGVQMGGIFHHSSVFANAVPKAFTKKIMKAYETEKSKKDFDLKSFVNTYFETNSDVSLKNGKYADINEFLIQSLEKMKAKSIAAKGSVIEMSKISIASREETYPALDYTESYFNMIGLNETGAKEMFIDCPKNFVYMMNEYDCIPQKNRSYSLTQTGPPYMSAMINLLEEVEGERILKFYLGTFFKEYQYWMNASYDLVPASQIDHSVKFLDGELLNRYWSESYKPRIDSYKEDKELIERIGDPKIMREVRAIEESTWLESSRWGMSNNNYEGANITNLIPVDLNALLYNLEKNIARAYKVMNQEPKSEFFYEKAAARKKALLKYCWNEERGYFFDYNYITKEQSDVVSIAGIYPLFFEMVDSKQAKKITATLEKELLKEGGLATTNSDTGLRWDSQYGKATYQWIAYKALKNYKQDSIADKIKTNWINSQKAYFEKHNTLSEFTIVDSSQSEDSQSGFATSSASILLKFLKE